ncbi:MAG: nucleotidyltransferase family protein [Alphaproteobacteria bacterium]|nr:nucleotidyltransferase family protein [Alphaproteobacteria bacterium]
MLAQRFPVGKAALKAFCRRYRIRRLALFGSVLSDRFGPESDVDVLVEFEAGEIPGLEFFDAERELSELVGRKVDLNTPAWLSRYFRAQVLSTAVDRYARP